MNGARNSVPNNQVTQSVGDENEVPILDATVISLDDESNLTLDLCVVDPVETNSPIEEITINERPQVSSPTAGVDSEGFIIDADTVHRGDRFGGFRIHVDLFTSVQTVE